MFLDKVILFGSIIIGTLSYITIFVVNCMLFRKTRNKAFKMIAAGVGCWILQSLIFLIAGYSLAIIQWEPLHYFSSLHEVGLIVISIGFVWLLRNYRVEKSSAY